MPSIDKSERRERKRHRAQHGQRTSGGSVKLLAEIIQKKAEKARKRRSK